jgi:phosphonoacetate hydrolase
VQRFRLPGEYIGDLMVLGDRDTVFGDLETSEKALPDTYRAPGSLYESAVPLIIHNWHGTLPEPEYFQPNQRIEKNRFRAWRAITVSASNKQPRWQVCQP